MRAASIVGAGFGIIKMQDKPYYLAYEARYKTVYGAGVSRWGHSPDDAALIAVLTKWVERENLRGKRVIEFACGEGASGEILSKLGCIYRGIDVSLSAVEKARVALEGYPDASVYLLDMVHERAVGKFDAALDVMGFHMLVTDADRRHYLQNAANSLNSGSPMLFYCESFRTDAYEGAVDSYQDWKRISGENYDTPQKRTVADNEVYIPLVPARGRTERGYRTEIEQAGFTVERFETLPSDLKIAVACKIYVRKI